MREAEFSIMRNRWLAKKGGLLDCPYRGSLEEVHVKTTFQFLPVGNAVRQKSPYLERGSRQIHKGGTPVLGGCEKKMGRI